jgi:hypothetical protein
MFHHVVLVRIDVSEERITSIIRMTKIGERGTTLALTRTRNTMRRTDNVFPSSPIVTLMMEAILSSETLILIRATPLHISEDDILQSHRLETSDLT